MGEEAIRKDMEQFQKSVKKLGQEINKASNIWSDKKFLELSNSVGEIAGISKNIILSGDRCCATIQRFFKIAQEKY